MVDIDPLTGLPKELLAMEEIIREQQSIKVHIEKRRYGKLVTIVDGINVTSGGATISGGIDVTGDTDFNGLLKEKVIVTAGKLSDNTNIYLENGCVHIFTTAESTTSTPAIKYSATANLKDKMSVGESVVVTLITTANASAYSANITIDGNAGTGVGENMMSGSIHIKGNELEVFWCSYAQT